MRKTTIGIIIDLPDAPTVRATGRIVIPVDPTRPQDSYDYLDAYFTILQETLEKRLNESAQHPELYNQLGYELLLPDL
jgi:hypothetical protein